MFHYVGTDLRFESPNKIQFSNHSDVNYIDKHLTRHFVAENIAGVETSTECERQVIQLFNEENRVAIRHTFQCDCKVVQAEKARHAFNNKGKTN